MWHNRTECYQSVSSMFCSHQLSNSSLSCGIVMRRPAAMPTTQRCICTIKSEYNKKFQDDISTRVMYTVQNASLTVCSLVSQSLKEVLATVGFPVLLNLTCWRWPAAWPATGCVTRQWRRGSPCGAECHYNLRRWTTSPLPPGVN